MVETKKIPFEGSELLGIKDDSGKLWLAIRNVCYDLGFSDGQTRRQVENARKDIVLSKGIAILRYPSKGGEQETLCVVEDYVTLWLAKISLTPTMRRNNPEGVQKLVLYQLKAAKTLHEAFFGTEEQKQEFFNDLGLTGRIEGMQVQINAMEDLLGEQTEMLNKMVENMTLSTRQQQKLYKAAKDRIDKLLDGAHGTKYKCYSKSYFINMWNELKERFGCSSYKDLNPMYYNEAFDFIAEWEYTER
nr:MAG TPA: hypothetical protein [Caudoviricetes sp.]